MATTTVTIDPEYLSTVTIPVAKEVVDAHYVKLNFLGAQERFWGKGKPTEEGGALWVQGWSIDEHSEDTEFLTGYEKLNLAVRKTIEDTQWTPVHIVRPVVLSLEEEVIQGTSTKVIDLAVERTEKVMGAMMRRFEEQALMDNVAAWANLETLNGVDDTAGFLENRASGSQSNTVGGLSKATYTAVTGTQNQWADIANSFNSNGLNALNAISIRARNRTKDPSKLALFMSETGLENYKRAVQGYERYISADTIDTGKLQLSVNGVAAETSVYLPSVTGQTSATDPLTAMLVDFNDIMVKFTKHPKLDGHFGMRPWRHGPGDQEIMLALCSFRGQLCARALGGSGLATRGETF
ncbi:MAG: hypothetical protein GY913_21470 [Proteobacteria bacterium]|nr:hypothetical protein [Actinomycetes bacterium]MCP4919479.1 hypothetical protein [Pseudomonadota bacterium]